MQVKNGWCLLLMLAVVAEGASATNQLTELLARLMKIEIQAAAGFTAKVLVPPGELYDPLVMHAKDNEVWLNDDGKVDGDKGSRMVAVDNEGQVKVLVDANKMTPVSAGFDIAPADFGAYGGQIFALSQPKIGSENQVENYLIQRIDPHAGFAVSVFCTLPPLDAKRVSGTGVDAGFAPHGSPFGNQLYAVTSSNGTIYTVDADGQCKPFTTFDEKRHGAPLYVRFAQDGKSLLVTVVRGGLYAASGTAVLRVLPDGAIVDQAVAEGGTMFGGLDIAPAEFGDYGGQLFVVDVGSFEIPVPQSQALRADGKVYRFTPDGHRELVVSGLINPWGLRFVGNRLLISDINGDFIYGKRELPDGFIVEVRAQ
jgi:hypothetical protein